MVVLIKLFGCDGFMNGGTFDGCGVCNGDDSSCDVIEGTFTELSTRGMVSFEACLASILEC